MNIIDTKDGCTMASVSSTIYKWEDFSRVVNSMVDTLLYSFDKSIQLASPFFLEGTWYGELYSPPYDDMYHFEFRKDGTVTVEIESYETNGNIIRSSGSGRYKYDSLNQVVTVSINRLSNKIQHIQNIRWSARIIIQDSENFSLIIPATSNMGSKMVNVDFCLDSFK